MKMDILTLFPDMFRGPLQESIIKRAREKKLLDIRIFNIRMFAKGKHRLTDDYPFGGGAGMVMKPEPVFEAIKAITGNPAAKSKRKKRKNSPWIILLTPQGGVFKQKKAIDLSKKDHLIFICGRYKGVDERIRQHLIDEEVSIGDYVLSGGESAAWVIIESVVRLIPDVVGDKDSVSTDSFYNENIFDYPQYTRPFEYLGKKVPNILISGNHKKIENWRRRKALEKTFSKRPNLFTKVTLSKDDKILIKKMKGEKL